MDAVGQQMTLRAILFGDNQFFGVNHMSEERARAQEIRFQSLDAIMEVLKVAYDEGAQAFMCTTHDRVAEICEAVRNRQDDFEGFEFYPCMPYAHKYANAFTEHGPIEAVRRLLPNEGGLMSLLKGGASVATGDVEGIARLLIDAEMKMFHGLKTPVIFLQNVVSDLLLGLGTHEAFKIFADHVREKYDAEPGFITMNLPMMLDALESVGIENPIVCANINKIGFRLSGGVELYEQTLRTRRFRAVAMSIFASGAIPPEEAIKYISELEVVKSVVFGASSRANIRQSVQLLKAALPDSKN